MVGKVTWISLQVELMGLRVVCVGQGTWRWKDLGVLVV
jgi:hypothetical protein